MYDRLLAIQKLLVVFSNSSVISDGSIKQA